MDRALATSFFVVNSDTIDQRELIIYRTPAEALAGEEPTAPTRPGDRRRARVIAVNQGTADAVADAARQLVKLSALAGDADARDAVSGLGPVYDTVFRMPVLASDIGEEAYAVVGTLMSVNSHTFASRLVIAVDLGEEQAEAPNGYGDDGEPWDGDTIILIDDTDGEQWVGAGRADNIVASAVPARHKITASGDILAKYFLYGEPTPAEPAAGEAEPAAGAEAEPVVIKIPWGEFTPGPPRDCLVEGIIAKYSAADIPANRRLSRATVTNFFEKPGPSLEALRAFADKFRIPLRVYDISGAEILSMRTTVAAGSGARRGMGVLAYNGHAYFREGSIAEDPKLHENMQAHDINTFIDTRVGSGAMDAAEREIQSRFLDWAPLNKSWRAERFVSARALMYTDAGAAGTAGHVCGDSCACGAEGWDMSKAYHTAVKKDFRGIGIPIAREIPIFTAVDDWVLAETEGAEFPRRHAWARTYFIIRPEIMLGWGSSGVAHLAGRINNLLTGPEFEYLVDTQRVRAEDVAAWKTATDSIQTGRYEHFTRRGDGPVPARAEMKHLTVLLAETPGRARTISGASAQTRLDRGDITVDDIEGWTATQKSFGAFLDELDGPAPAPDDALGGLTRAQFSTYHGLFGRLTTNAHSLLVSAGDLDAELLSLAHSNVEARENSNVHVELSKSRDLLMNSRTTYDYIVASTSLIMMRLADEVAQTTGARIIKVKTDGIVFDRPVKLPAWAAEIFHREPVRLSQYPAGKMPIYPADLVEKISKEVDEVVEKIVGYVGAPGTGKTHAVKTNHKYHEAMAFSNITARNLDSDVEGVHVRGRTLDEGLRLQAPADLNSVCGRARGRTWWIDEISTIKARVWSVIVEVAGRGLERLILTGDPNQIPPIMERFRNDSMLIKAILSRAQRLTHDYRNDAGLVGVRERVLKLQTPGNDTGASEFMRDVYAEHPTLSPTGRGDEMAAADVHITHTRAAAARVNRWIASTRGLKFERLGEGPKATHAIDAGVRLRSCENFKDQAGALVCNGDVFELIEPITAESDVAKLRRLSFDAQARAADEIAVPAKMLHAFELGWAFTTHSTIGITVRGQMMCIYEAERMIETDPAILYTAVTRACLIESVILSGNVPAHIPV